MSDDERADFDETYDATRVLALEVGERVRERVGSGRPQPAGARCAYEHQLGSGGPSTQAGGTGATLTTLQKVASALDLTVSVELTPAG